MDNLESWIKIDYINELNESESICKSLEDKQFEFLENISLIC